MKIFNFELGKNCILHGRGFVMHNLIFMEPIDASAAGVVPCGGPKMSPRTSSIVQIIFSFWAFEISDDILGNQKIILNLDTFNLNTFNRLALFRFACHILTSQSKISNCLWFHVARFIGSLMRFE